MENPHKIQTWFIFGVLYKNIPPTYHHSYNIVQLGIIILMTGQIHKVINHDGI